MPTDKLLHIKKAKSASARLCKNDPKATYINFILLNGEFLTVALPLHVMKRFVLQATKLLEATLRP